MSGHKNMNQIKEPVSPESENLISFLLTHFHEDQEIALLSKFEHSEPIYLSDIYKDSCQKEISEHINLNIYESAYLRLLLDFNYIKARNLEEPVPTSLLYCLLNKGLFCVAVDFIMALTFEEAQIFASDLNLLSFFNKRLEDGNIRYLKKTIFK